MASLTGQKIKDTYQSLLKTADNGLITNAFKGITDGSGSASGLYIKDNGILVSGSLVLSGSLLYSGSTIDATVTSAISASYALTASYAMNGGGGGSVDTGSFATTGSNTFTGDQIVTGSINASGSITTNNALGAQMFMNPQTVTSYINIPTEHNAFLVGPLAVEGTVAIGSGSNLSIFNLTTGGGGGSVDTSSLATTGPNTFIGNQTISGSIQISGSIIPATNGVSTTSSFNLGSATNAWKDIFVSNGTINFLDGAGNVQATLASNEQGLILPEALNFSSSIIQSVPTSSGDGAGLSTLELKPDTSTGDNRYIILDPTAPNHIHVRAGGTIDQSNADLYIGGEKNYVRVSDSSPIVRMQTTSTININSNYFNVGDAYVSAVWETVDDVHQITINDPSPSIYATVYEFNNVSVFSVVDNVSNPTLEILSSSTPGGPNPIVLTVNLAPPSNPTNLDQLYFEINQARETYIQTDGTDIRMEAADDVRIYSNDIFRLRNYATDEGIEITTDYDNGNYEWYFGPDGTLQFPDGTYQSTAFTTESLSEFVTTGSNTFVGNQTISGSLSFGDGSLIQSVSASSGDGYGLTTLQLTPNTTYESDQYIVLDPTFPNHIHIRAGGIMDASTSDLYLGGENTNVLVDDGGQRVRVTTTDIEVQFLGYIDNGFGDGPGATLHVTDIINGTITDGMTIYGPGIPGGYTLQFGSVIEPQGNGGVGNYYLPGGDFLTPLSVYTGGTITTNNWNFEADGKLNMPGALEQGYNVLASGSYSHAEGNITTAVGDYSHAEGDNTQAIGNYSHAEGQETIASGQYSHAEGYQTIASGSYSHAEGEDTRARGDWSHAEGYDAQARGDNSHAEGDSTQAIGVCSHAEGYSTRAIGDNSHAEGSDTRAIGDESHAEGDSTIAIGDKSHAEGNTTKTGTQNAYYAESVVSGVVTLSGSYGDVVSQFGANNRLYLYDTPFDDYYGRATFIISQSYYNDPNTIVELYDTGVNTTTAYVGDLGQGIENWNGDQTIPGNYSHTEGSYTQAIGNSSHAEGISTRAIGERSHAEGAGTEAIGYESHAEGGSTQAIGQYSHAEGVSTQAIGEGSHAEGGLTITIGDYSHAEGELSEAIGNYSHAEGQETIASGSYSHAEGSNTQAIERWSHAEGNNTQAIGEASHTEGQETQAVGNYSHAEGDSTNAIGESSHAEGSFTVAIGYASHAEGRSTIASGSYQHVSGQYNLTSSAQSAFIVGNGSDDNNRSNLIHAGGSVVEITGSLDVTSGITGSLFGTASFALSASWAPGGGGGTPGGSDTEIQFNNGGQFSGSASFRFIYTSQSLEQGYNVTASKLYSHAEGYGTIADALSGYNTLFDGYGIVQGSSHAEGIGTQTTGSFAHAEGYITKAIGHFSHTEGYKTQAVGEGSHAEGISTQATGYGAHAEGRLTQAIGNASHAEGNETQAIGFYSHAEGFNTRADALSGYNTLFDGYGTAQGYSHAEGIGTQTTGSFAHAEGYITKAIGHFSHTEGYKTQAVGNGSHAEGTNTIAIGQVSHAEGEATIAVGYASHAEGNQTIASGSYQHVSGKFNEHNNTTSVIVVGIGLNNNNRKDGFTVDVDTNGSGSVMIPNNVSTPSTAKTGSMYVDPTNNKLWIFTGNGGVGGWVTASLG